MTLGLKEEMDLQGSPAEASFGENLLKNYQESYDLVQQSGVRPEKLFNAFYQKDRATNPDLDVETWSKSNGMDKFLVGAKQFEAEYAQQKADVQTRADNEANMGDFSRGMVGGIHKTAGLLSGLGMLGASKFIPGKLGEGLASWFGDAYKEQMRQSALYPTKTIMSEKEGEIFDFSQIKGPGDAIDWVQGTMGDLFPSMAVGMISGGIGGLLAQGMAGAEKGIAANVMKGFLEKQSLKLVDKGFTRAAADVMAKTTAARLRGGAFGQVIGTAMMETGGNFAQAVDHFAAKFEADGMDSQTARLSAMEEASGTLAMVTGTASGLIERLGGASRLLDGILGKGASDAVSEVLKVVRSGRANPTVLGKTLNIAKNLLVEAVKQMPEEFGQEAAQEILSLSNLDFSDPDFQMMTAENLREVIGAGIAGAVGGAGSAMSTRVVGSVNEVLGRTQPADVKGQIQSLQLRIRNQEETLAKDPNAAPGVVKSLEQNRRDLEDLSGYAKAEATGISYADAAAKINKAAPDPEGKKTFGVRQLKNMLRDGRIEKLEDGTVDPVSLAGFLESRKAKAEGETDAAKILARVTEAKAKAQTLKDAAGVKFDENQTKFADSYKTQSEVETAKEQKIFEAVKLQAETLRAKASGTPDQKITDPDGKERIVPGKPARFLQPEEQKVLKAYESALALDDPKATIAAIREFENTESVLAKASLNADASALSATQDLSTPAAGIEQASQEPPVTEAAPTSAIVDEEQRLLDQASLELSDNEDQIPTFSDISDTQSQVLDQQRVNEDVPIGEEPANVDSTDFSADMEDASAPVRPPAHEMTDVQRNRYEIHDNIMNTDFTTWSVDAIQKKLDGQKKRLPKEEQRYGQNHEVPYLMRKEIARLEEAMVEKESTPMPEVDDKLQQELDAQGEKNKNKFPENKDGMDQSSWQVARTPQNVFTPETHAKDLSKATSQEKDFDPAADLETDDIQHIANKVEFFRTTLIENIGEKAYQKLVDYGLIRLDRLAKSMAASYFPKAGMAVFDPEKMNTVNDVLTAFYHEIGVHHGLEALIVKHSGQKAWDNFRKSFVRELTAKKLSKDGVKFREAYDRVMRGYVKNKDAAKRFGVLEGKSIEEQMNIDYFFHEFLGQIADMTDWSAKKLPDWAMWLKDRVLQFMRALGFQIAPTFEQLGSLIQGAVAHVMLTENTGIRSERLIASNNEAIAQGLVEGVDLPSAQAKTATEESSATETPAATNQILNTPPLGKELSMHFKHDGDKNIMRDDLLKRGITSTFDAIWEGMRTGTTRDIDFIKKQKIKVGDILHVSDKGRAVTIEVTEIAPVTDMEAEEWSKIEGWDASRFLRHVKKENEVQIRFKVLSRHEKTTAPLSIPAAANFKETTAPAQEKATQPAKEKKKEVEEKTLEERVEGLARKGRASSFLADLEKIIADDISRIAGSDRVTTKEQLDTPLSLDFVGPLDGVPFFSINARSDSAKKEEQKIINKLLKENMWKHSASLRNLERLMNVQKDGRQGSEYTAEDIDTAIRKLPDTDRLGLVASLAPKAFKKMLADRQSYIESTTDFLLSEVDALDGDFIWDGSLDMYLQGVQAFMSDLSMQLNQSPESLAAVAELRNEYRSEIAKAKDRDERKAIGVKYGNLIKEERLGTGLGTDGKVHNMRTSNLKKEMKALFEKVKGLTATITDSKSQFYKDQEAFHGQRTFAALREAIGEREKQINAVISNLEETRKNLAKGRLPYLELNKTLVEIANPSAPVFYVTERPPIEHIGAINTYVQRIVDMVEKSMESVQTYKIMTADAKKLYLRMIRSFVTVRVYSGRVAAELRKKHADNVEAMKLRDMTTEVNGGSVTPAQVEIILDSLNVEATQRDKKKEARDQEAMLPKFKLAEQLRSFQTVGVAIFGVKDGKTIDGFRTVKAFKDAVISLHNEIVNLLIDSGVVISEATKQALSFPDLHTYDNWIEDRKFAPGMSEGDSIGRKIIKDALAEITETYGVDYIKVPYRAMIPMMNMFPDPSGLIASREKSKNPVENMLRFDSPKIHEVDKILDAKGKLVELRKEHPELAALTDNEIKLAIIGLGFEGGDKGIAGSTYFLPEALKLKYKRAGFLDKSLKPLRKPTGPAAKIIGRTLSGESEYMMGARPVAFFEGPYTPADGEMIDFRQIVPGAMLYAQSNEKIYYVGGRTNPEVAEEKGAKTQKSFKDRTFTLLEPVEIGHGLIKLQYVMDKKGEPKRYSLADLSAIGADVVPKVWDMYAGFTDYNTKEFRILDSFEFFNARMAIARRQRLEKVIEKVGDNRLSSAAYADVVTDASGQQRLVTYSPNTGETIYTVAKRKSKATLAPATAYDVALAKIGGDERLKKALRKLGENSILEDDAEQIVSEIISEIAQTWTGQGISKKDQAAVRERLEAFGDEAISRAIKIRDEDENIENPIITGETTIDDQATQADNIISGEQSEDPGDANPMQSKAGYETLIDQEEILLQILRPTQTILESGMAKGKNLVTDKLTPTEKRSRGLLSVAWEVHEAYLDAEDNVHRLEDEVAHFESIMKDPEGSRPGLDKTSPFYVMGDTQLSMDLLFQAKRLFDARTLELKQAREELKSLKDTRAMFKDVLKGIRKKPAGETLDSKANVAQAKAIQERVTERVRNLDLGVAEFQNTYTGVFGALPASAQRVAGSLLNALSDKFKNEKGEAISIGAAIAQGKIAASIQGLIDAGQTHLALQVAAGLSLNSYDFVTDSNEKVTQLEARIAYAKMLGDTPIPMNDGKTVPLRELKGDDRSYAVGLLAMAGVFKGYQRAMMTSFEYNEAMKPWLGDKAGQVLLAKSIKGAGLSRMLVSANPLASKFTPSSSKFDLNLSSGEKAQAGNINVGQLVTDMATGLIPADIYYGYVADTLEARMDVWSGKDYYDNTKRQYSQPDMESLTPDDFRKELDAHIVSAVLEIYERGSAKQKKIANKLQSNTTMVNLIDLLSEHYESPGRELINIARELLDADMAGVRSVDDITSFTGMDGVKYSVQSENQMDANREVYPPLNSEVMTRADYSALMAYSSIFRGAFDKIKLNQPRGNGMSQTISIGDSEAGIDLREGTLTDFGWSLVSSLKRAHDEAIKGGFGPKSLQIRRAIKAALGIDSDTGDKVHFRTRAVTAKHTLDPDKMWSPDSLKAEADAIIAEIAALSGQRPDVIFHGPAVTALDALTKDGLKEKYAHLFSQEIQDLLASNNPKDRAAKSKLIKDLRNAMGMVDVNGNIHVFISQHARADGSFDKTEFYKTIYHEAVGHLGLRKVLGAQYEDFLVGVYNKFIGKGAKTSLTRAERADKAEEYMASMAEQIKNDQAAGRPTNKHIGTLIDRVATMVILAFRKIAKKLGFTLEESTSMFEVRDMLAQAFKGSRVAGRSGFSSLLSPSMIPGENLVNYHAFDEYTENSADVAMRNITDSLKKWDSLEKSVTNFDGTIKDSEDFLPDLRTQKSRVGNLSKMAKKLQAEFVEIFRGKNFDQDDAGWVAHALHAIELNAVGLPRYIDKLVAKKRAAHDELIEMGFFDGKPDELEAAEQKLRGDLAKLRERLNKKHLSDDLKGIAGVSTNDARKFLDQAVAAGYLTENADGSYSGEIMEAVNKLVAINDVALELAANSGMISHTMHDYIKSEFKYFIPIPGYEEKVIGLGELYSFKSGNRLARMTPDALSLPPTEREERSVIGAVFASLRARASESETNGTYRTIMNFVIGHPNAKLFQVFVPQERFDAMIEDNGMETASTLNAKGVFVMPSMGTMTIVEAKEFEMQEGFIPVYVAGRLNYIKVLDQGLAKGLEKLNGSRQAGRVMRVLGYVNRWLVKVNTSLNPAFFMPNMIKDLLAAYNTLSIQGQISGTTMDGEAFAKKVMGNITHAMKAIAIRNFGGNPDSLSPEARKIYDNMDSFEKSGGMIQWAFLESAEATTQSVEAGVRRVQGKATAGEKVKYGLDYLEGKVQDFAGVFENSTRLAIFSAMLDAGASTKRAALAARETTVDFDRKGEWGEIFNTLYMFANAGIQGTLVILRAVSNNPARAAKIAGKIVAASVAVGLMGALLGGDDDDDEASYFKISQEIRNSNMIFMIPGFDTGLKIPCPYGYGAVWALGQELVSVIMGQKDTSGASLGMIGALLNNFNPLESSAKLTEAHGWVRMLSPTITDPLIDIGFEKTPFGTPLMPEKVYEDQPDSARHWRSVSGGSKAVAEWLNSWGGSAGKPGYVSMSPESMDLLFEQATGGLGRLVTRSISLAMSPMTGKELGANDIPIARRFMATSGKWEDRSIFQSNYNEIHGVNRTLKNLTDNVRLAREPELKKTAQRDLVAFREENGHILAMRAQVNNVYARVKQIDERKKALYKSGLPDAETAPKLRALDDQQRKVFVNFNKLYNERVDK